MTITLNGNTGITSPGITSDTGLTADGINFASGTPANTLVTDTSGNVGIGTSSPSAKLDIASGNLNFSATGQRITGDFSNATAANRVMFQTSTVNGASYVFNIPNGTGTVSGYYTANNSDVNNSSYMAIRANATEASVVSSYAGTGTYLPLTMYTGGSERMRIDTSGNVGIGNTPSGTYKLEVSGLVSDTAGNLRSLPLNSQTSAYVAAATDNGKVISITTGGVTINNSVFSAGMVLTIYNNSGSSQTITQGTGVTLQWAGQSSSTTGNRTLGLYGMATVYFLSASSAVITGSGLT